MIEQFDGYFERTVVPITEWDENDMPRYPEGYDHFTCEDTSLLKQPDVVMLMFVLPTITRCEPGTPTTSSTSPGPSTSPRSARRSTRSSACRWATEPKAEQYFARSAYVDVDDNQGNTEEGMHIASAGGTLADRDPWIRWLPPHRTVCRSPGAAVVVGSSAILGALAWPHGARRPRTRRRAARTGRRRTRRGGDRVGRAYRPDPGNAGDGHPLTGYAVGRRGRRRSVLRVDVDTPPDRLILDEAAPT